MNTRWLDGAEMDAWLRFVAVVELLPGALDTQLRRDSGIPHFDYYVLAALSEAPDRSLRMTTLARHTNGSLTRLSHLVRRLEERGLIERTHSPDDARVTNVHLTNAGWDVVREAAPGHVDAVRHFVMDNVPREQLANFTAILNGMVEQLDPNGTATRFAAERRLSEADDRSDT